MGAFDDREEFGRRIAAARGYTRTSQEEFGKAIGRSDKTVANIEKGDPGAGPPDPAGRRQFAERVATAWGCPPELLGLSEPPSNGEIQELRRAVGALATLATTPDLGPAARRLLEVELAAARQWSTSNRPTEEPESGAGSG